MDIFLIGLIGLFSGTIKGSSGFGSSLVALPLLAFFYPIEQVVIMMITINVFLNFIMMFEDKNFSLKNLKDIKVLVIFGVLFTFIGLQLLTSVDEKIIKYFAAILIFIAVVNKSLRINFKLKDSNLFKAIVGAISGFSNGIASIDGPPIVFYLTSIETSKAKFKSTLVTYFLILGGISVLLLFRDGQYSLSILKDTLYIGIYLAIGVFMGIKISKRIDEKRFEKYITILLIVLGISMII